MLRPVNDSSYELGDTTAAVLRRELTYQYRRLMIRGLIATPLAAPVFAYLSYPESTPTRIAIWVTIALVSFLINVGITLAHRGIAGDTLWIFSVPAFLIGATWGATPYIIDPQNPVAQAIVTLVLVAVCAVATVMNAPNRMGFLAMTVPIIALGGSYLLTANDGRLRALAPAALILFAIMALIHHEVHGTITRAIVARVRNDILLDELNLERERIERTNQALLSANARLKHRATHDPLTGLLNRSALTERLESLVAQSAPGAGVAVLYLDLDRFKLVNDSLGHHVGDQLLQEASRRCIEALPNAPIARLGGDEFCVLLHPVATPTDATRAADRIRSALDASFEVAGRSVGAPVSIGIAIGFGDTTPEDLHRYADVALYRAKDRGRNQVALFDQHMRDSMDQVIDQGAALRDALAAERIVPWFQPEIDLTTGDMIGVEALARWVSPTGVLDASSFMPTAEQVGLELMISDAMMVSALVTRYEWHQLGIDPGFRVRINATAQQITSPDHVRKFLRGIEANGIPPTGVSIEITETSVIRDIEVVSSGLALAREAGITVALDDFGTGHSSLSLLQRLPIDAVKIDRSFIRNLVDDSRDRALVKTVISLGSELGLTVTAEGVETEAQAELLRSFGCNSAQGYLYSPAIPSEQVLARIGRDSTATLAAR
jgi:diguanylate cyclase (GGDEF)-like protein